MNRAIDYNTDKVGNSNFEHFKEAYMQAYDGITPNKNCVARIAEKVEERQMQKFQIFVMAMRPVVTVCVLVLILSMTVLPVVAKSIPSVFGIIEEYAPALIDFVLPEEVSDTSAGITMQVEAINVEGHDADILVSFSDAEGSDRDLIKGKVDLYDSYHLRSFGASYNIGGCSFLEYDEITDKAYFKITVSGDGVFDKGRLRFRVRQLLTNLAEEKQWIELKDRVLNPTMKYVSLSGQSGSGDWAVFDRYMGGSTEEEPRPTVQVLDLQRPEEGLADALTVIGVAYSDGILRVQSCRGNLSEADRHMQPFIIDSEGNERHNDFSVGWHETVNGEQLSFNEHWFLVEESELEQLQMYGIFWNTDGNVKGDWEVTFRVEE